MKDKKLPMWLELVVGISFLILGIFAINQPGQTLGFLIIWFGILALFRGVTTFIRTLMYERDGGRLIFAHLFFAVIDMLFGFLLVTNLYRGFFLVGVIFALWFISDSVSNLLHINRVKHGGKFMTALVFIFDIICIGIGLRLLFNPVFAALTLPILVGFYAIFFGITSILLAFKIR